MLAVEQLGQKPFKWMEGLSDGPCPEIDRPFRAFLEDYCIVFEKTLDDDWRFVVSTTDAYFRVTGSIIEKNWISTVFKMINFALSSEETHPDHEEFDAFFREYDVIRFIP